MIGSSVLKLFLLLISTSLCVTLIYNQAMVINNTKDYHYSPDHTYINSHASVNTYSAIRVPDPGIEYVLREHRLTISYLYTQGAWHCLDVGYFDIISLVDKSICVYPKYLSNDIGLPTCQLLSIDKPEDVVKIPLDSIIYELETMGGNIERVLSLQLINDSPYIIGLICVEVVGITESITCRAAMFTLFEYNACEILTMFDFTDDKWHELYLLEDTLLLVDYYERSTIQDQWSSFEFTTNTIADALDKEPLAIGKLHTMTKGSDTGQKEIVISGFGVSSIYAINYSEKLVSEYDIGTGEPIDTFPLNTAISPSELPWKIYVP